MILGLNICTPEEEESCKKQLGSRKERACKRCEKKKAGKIHPWALHLVDLWRLQKAGYPFEKNDLGYQEWIDLGIVNQLLERR